MATVPQAGAIAFRMKDRAPQILLVRAKKNPEHWIFPKGHIEDGETAATSAERELEEEAAITGELIDFIGDLSFQSGSDLVTVAYFLFKFLAEIKRTEDRESRWCSYEETLSLLSHPEAARLLKQAYPLMTLDARVGNE